MKKWLFPLLLLISIAAYAKDNNCGNSWLEEDFRISVLGRTLCCDRGAEQCEYKSANSIYTALSLWRFELAQNPKEAAHNFMRSGEDKETVVYKCAHKKAWLRIRSAQAISHVQKFTRYTTLRFTTNAPIAGVSMSDVVNTFCSLDPFAVSEPTDEPDAIPYAE